MATRLGLFNSVEVVMRRSCTVIGFAILSVVAFLLVELKPTRAQDAAAPVVAAPSELIEQMMTLIGDNHIDQATLLLGNLRSTPDIRNTVREQLDHLHDDQGTYHGYEIVASQKISNQFQSFEVMAYYDQQPVLLRFHFYRTQATATWNVIGFQAVTSIADLTEVLKDTPIEYPVHKIAK